MQFAFKPHPLLKQKLYATNSWGKERTDDYYEYWEKLSNGQIETGQYIDLFYFSNAMIMDSASFIVKYLYFDKPLCFTMQDNNVKDRFNSFGRMVFDYLYTAEFEKEIIYFIDNIVINENDYLRKNKNNFLKDVILPRNGKTASENIVNELKKELC
jgi:CDP-glycerol glycerophosphotransferase (TagB/SpsB family)